MIAEGTLPAEVNGLGGHIDWIFSSQWVVLMYGFPDLMVAVRPIMAQHGREQIGKVMGEGHKGDGITGEHGGWL